MEHDLTFEKFKINERLQGVETEVALLRQAINELKTSKNEYHDHLTTELVELRKILYGTDLKEGLIIETAELYKEHQNRGRHLAVIYSVVAGLLIHTVWRHIVVTQQINTITKEVQAR